MTTLCDTTGRRATIADIKTLTAQVFGVSLCEIDSLRREPIIVRARWAVAWLCRALPGPSISLARIGRALGDRDHTTILHGLRRASRLRKHCPSFAVPLSRLHQIIIEDRPMNEHDTAVLRAVTTALRDSRLAFTARLVLAEIVIRLDGAQQGDVVPGGIMASLDISTATLVAGIERLKALDIIDAPRVPASIRVADPAAITIRMLGA